MCVCVCVCQGSSCCSPRVSQHSPSPPPPSPYRHGQDAERNAHDAQGAYAKAVKEFESAFSKFATTAAKDEAKVRQPPGADAAVASVVPPRSHSRIGPVVVQARERHGSRLRNAYTHMLQMHNAYIMANHQANIHRKTYLKVRAGLRVRGVYVVCVWCVCGGFLRGLALVRRSVLLSH